MIESESVKKIPAKNQVFNEQKHTDSVTHTIHNEKTFVMFKFIYKSTE